MFGVGTVVIPQRQGNDELLVVSGAVINISYYECGWSTTRHRLRGGDTKKEAYSAIISKLCYTVFIFSFFQFSCDHFVFILILLQYHPALKMMMTTIS